MNEFHDMLRGASDAAGRGSAVDGAERAELRREVSAGRRRRTMGTAAAALAGVVVIGATTVALASGGSRDAGPAASTSTPSPTAASSLSAGDGVLRFGDSSLEGAPVSMDLAGSDSTVEFASWSNEQFAETGIDIMDVRPALDPVPAAELEGYGEGWAFVEDSVVDDQDVPSRSALLLARPDGTSVEVADLVAMADELGLGDLLGVLEVASSAESPQVMALLAGDAGTAIVWMDLASGDTWAFSFGDGVYVEAISWRRETEWLAWGYAGYTPLAFGLSVTSGAAALGVDDAWVPWAGAPGDSGGISTVPGLVIVYGRAASDTTVLVDADDTVYVVENGEDAWGDVIGRSGDCYLIERASLLGVETEGGLGCVDAETGEVSLMDDLPGPSTGASVAAFGEGYLESPAFESDGTTAVWHLPSGDVEIEVPAGSLVEGSSGEVVWFGTTWAGALTTATIGAVGTDGVYRGIDLPFADAGVHEAAYAYPVG